ncbi:MAG: hypothetical protein ABIR46_04495 [Candidatus Saccharimonadales bacterium]
MSRNDTLYQKTVQVTEEYLGPAGERFIRRQIATHLKIEPELLRKRDLSELIDWSSIAFAMVTSNTRDVDAFTDDLRALSLESK